MASVDLSLRPFVPGTTGWAAGDLDDPEIERLWFDGRYEIIDGVLTTMAPAYYIGHKRISQLIEICTSHARAHQLHGWFVHEVDIVIDDSRVVVSDVVWMTPDDERRQTGVASQAGKPDPERTRILVPPTLVIESISPGHERHDRQTKFRWYAEFGIKNYWILDAFKHSLDCYILDGISYRLDASSHDTQPIRPSVFPGLVISLSEIWAE